MSGGSSSSSASTTNTANYSLQGIEGNSAIITGDNNQLTDFGAIEKALDTTAHIYDETVDLLKTTNNKALEYNQKATDNALDFASNISKPSDERTTESIIKYAGIALIGVVVTTAFKRVAK